MTATEIVSIDPTQGQEIEVVATASTSEQVDAQCERAAAAAAAYDDGGRALRAHVLRSIADGLERRRAEIVALGQRETALASARLEGELNRTVYQARLFAEAVDEGSFLEVAIDHAGDTPMGPGPDLRRMLVPIGPVAVFGASNFPLAFSVPGGDTVSALAAGCSVVLKGHESHPALSVLVHETMTVAAAKAGAPDDLLGLVFGLQAGVDLVQHQAIRAVAFTGSLAGGHALMEAIAARPDPIPFFGELASLNPVVVTPSAASARAAQLAAGIVASVTGSAGQLCTKPGVVLVPNGGDGDALVAETGRLVAQTDAAVVLNARVRDGYCAVGEALSGVAGMRVVASGGTSDSAGFWVTPRLLEIPAAELGGVELHECFGPTTVLIRYDPGQEMEVIEALPGSLTGTIHAEEDERELVVELTRRLRGKVGRLLYDGFPTGVLVSWAQHHGGPWPATNSQHTSVGVTAVRRFQRPLVWQDAPVWLLPEELRDGPTPVPRRIDGRLTVPENLA